MNTREYAHFNEVIHDYSNFDFTKIPLLESEEDFQEYHKAFMEKYGNHPSIRNEMGEDIPWDIILETAVDENNVRICDIMTMYNTAASEMGHLMIGEDPNEAEEEDWDEGDE